MEIFRALVIEDQDLYRDMLQRRLKAFFGKQTLILVVGTLEGAEDLLREQEFGLIVTDPGLPGFNPMSDTDRLAVIEQVVTAHRKAIHIVITGAPTLDEANKCRRLGVTAYVGKTGLDPDMLEKILESSVKGEFVTHLSDVAAPERDFHFHYSELTEREEDIFNRVLHRSPGKTRNDVFAEVKDLWGVDSVETVKKYYQSARGKVARKGLLPKGI